MTDDAPGDPFDDPEVRALMARHGIVRKPGMAADALAEMAPLLADEGIDLDDLEAADLPRVNAALARATERRNLELFTPISAGSRWSPATPATSSSPQNCAERWPGRS